jgi:hypothetical protein
MRTLAPLPVFAPGGRVTRRDRDLWAEIGG